MLPLDKLHDHQIILLVFKCLNYAHLLPPVYANYVLDADFRAYNTGARADLHVLGLRSRPLLKDKGVLDIKAVLWNGLPVALKLPTSIHVFNRNIKKYLSSQ